ncbi:hypothetical protein Q7C36_006138 [Tachysurus vachellii]|uniref:SCAN box domain-containing protein n=1 Tax=Tachysurus vachellii TaxID=175792 RepID=A0AA88NIZ7_TACVA|nr:hypothetical protein Q7C36_006138 [Tachysurus vachellii]
MATRKSATRGRKPRVGLRSQSKAMAESDVAWDTAESTEEERELPPVRPKVASPRRPESPAATSKGEMYSVIRDFLNAQEQREERYVKEIQSLRESILQAVRPAEEPTEDDSPRMELPTPVRRKSTACRGDRDSRSDMGHHHQPTPRTEPKLPVFQQGEDIESFLHRFERLARTWRWPEEEWSYQLVPLLSGQALEAYLAMDEDRAEDYAELKEALLEKFNISPETYRQRFRATSTPAGESPTETYNRLNNLYRRWVRPELHTKEEIGETVVLEQFLRVLPYEIRVWVKEHDPATGLDAAKLAQQYLHAHRGSQRSQPEKGPFIRLMVANTRGLEYMINAGSQNSFYRLFCLCLHYLLNPFHLKLSCVRVCLLSFLDCLLFVCIILNRMFSSVSLHSHACVSAARLSLVTLFLVFLVPHLKASFKLISRRKSVLSSSNWSHASSCMYCVNNHFHEHCVHVPLKLRLKKHRLHHFGSGVTAA